jgi:hypothetical protein
MIRRKVIRRKERKRVLYNKRKRTPKRKLGKINDRKRRRRGRNGERNAKPTLLLQIDLD